MPVTVFWGSSKATVYVHVCSRFGKALFRTCLLGGFGSNKRKVGALFSPFGSGRPYHELCSSDVWFKLSVGVFHSKESVFWTAVTAYSVTFKGGISVNWFSVQNRSLTSG